MIVKKLYCHFIPDYSYLIRVDKKITRIMFDYIPYIITDIKRTVFSFRFSIIAHEITGLYSLIIFFKIANIK